MDDAIFKFKSTQGYLLAVLGDKSQRKGLKSQAARFMQCHTSVISQILHGKVQLNLEQADKLNQFLRHGEDESHYFLLMTQKERAGTRSLHEHFQKQIHRFLEDHLMIKKRIGTTGSVSKNDEQKYYSAWIYAAVHVALSAPHLRTADALANTFRVPVNEISPALKFLVEAGLAVQSRGEFNIGPKHVHLAATSPYVAGHHRNWRVKALQSLDSISDQDLHYSAAITLSREDVGAIKDKLIENLKGLNKTIQASPEEEVYAMSFDFFKL